MAIDHVTQNHDLQTSSDARLLKDEASMSDDHRGIRPQISTDQRKEEPVNHPLTSASRRIDFGVESPKEEEQQNAADINGVPFYSVSLAASPTATEQTQGVDGSESPTAQRSIEKPDIYERPPQLPYCLWDHKLAICFFCFLILAESCFVPISLYYGLIYGTNLRHGARESTPVHTFQIPSLFLQTTNPPCTH